MKKFLQKLFGAKEEKTWTTREGQVIPFTKLGDNHLINILAMLKRNAERQYQCAVLVYAKAPILHGEMAQLAFEQEYEQLLDASWVQFRHKDYDDLLAEAQRRQLMVPLELVPPVDAMDIFPYDFGLTEGK